MKILTFAICLFFVISASADNHKHKKHRGTRFEPSVFEVTPLNSPVKGSTAKFALKLPKGFEVDKVKVKLVNARDLTKDQKKFDEVKVSNNNELSVSVSKLPPGFYRLYVTVVDKKSKKEHCFQSKFHDFVRFVVDTSVQVPEPDPKKNDVTIGGIDSDKDGIRDDIQRYINETYSNEQKIQTAIKQAARDWQAGLEVVNDKEASILASLKILDTMSCVEFVAGFDNESRIRSKIKSLLLNTKDRIYADIKANANFNGQEYEGPRNIEEQKAACDFNPDNL